MAFVICGGLTCWTFPSLNNMNEKVRHRCGTWTGKRKIVTSHMPNHVDGERVHIWVCQGPSCRKDGARNIVETVRWLAPTSVTVRKSSCLGKCGTGPNIAVSKGCQEVGGVVGVRETNTIVALLQDAGQAPIESKVVLAKCKEDADRMLLLGGTAAAKAAAELYEQIACNLHTGDVLLVSTLCNWSAALAESGSSGEALRVANAAVDADVGHARAWRRKAQAHELIGDIDRAISAWTMVTRLNGEGTTAEEAKRCIDRLRRPKWRLI